MAMALRLPAGSRCGDASLDCPLTRALRTPTKSLEVEVLAVQALNLSSSALRSSCASVSCDRPSFFLASSGTLSRVAGLLFWEKGIGFRKKHAD
jgi:hypothetical protein